MLRFLKKSRLYILFLLLLPAGYFLNFLSRRHPHGTDRFYSRMVYPVLSSVVSAVTGLVPLSVAEFALFALAAIVVIFLLYTIFHIRKIKLIHVGRFFLKILCAGCAAYFLFVTMWALNYNRLPLRQNLGYKDGDVTKEELAAVMSSQVDSIDALCHSVHFDSKRHSYEPGGIRRIQLNTNNGFVQLASENKLFNKVPVHPKPVLMSTLMSYAGIDGIYIPFTCEPCVNTVCPQFMIPVNMSHESAHLKGFAKEDEANFVSYLAGMQNSDAYFRYSAHMMAYIYVSNALYSTDSGLWNEIAKRLDSRANSDLQDYNHYVDRFSGPVQKTSEKINDTYLKSQGQPQGVQSYDEFVNLICAQYRTQTGKS